MKTAKIMNGDIRPTLAALCHCQRASIGLTIGADTVLKLGAQTLRRKKFF